MFLPIVLASALVLSSYTNHAGHVVTGCPVAITNGLVSLTRDGTNCWRVPFAAFPPSEQVRLRAAVGRPGTQSPTTNERRRSAFCREMRLRRGALRTRDGK